MIKTVIRFINEFTGGGRNEQVINCFMNGCCYWFAKILKDRFAHSDVMYSDRENHFGCRIGRRVYDITGEVTNAYDWEPWADFIYREPRQAALITQGCILKEPHIFEEDDA